MTHAWRLVGCLLTQVPGLASMRLQPDLSAVSEELNVLYAQHEIVASTTGQTLEWFASLPAVSS